MESLMTLSPEFGAAGETSKPWSWINFRNQFARAEPAADADDAAVHAAGRDSAAATAADDEAAAAPSGESLSMTGGGGGCGSGKARQGRYG